MQLVSMHKILEEKMSNVSLKKLNTKSENGFTFTDLAIAIFVIMIFAGTIGTILYQITELKLSTRLSAEATVCAIQILEDIDRTDYELIQNGMENDYKNKFQIPDGFALKINVTNSSKTVGGCNEKSKRCYINCISNLCYCINNSCFNFSYDI